ncbi:MAG: hypothetical protein ACOVPA_17720 [Rubrivivax sp.]
MGSRYSADATAQTMNDTSAPPHTPAQPTPFQPAHAAQAAGRLAEAATWYEQALAHAPDDPACLV